MMTMRRIHGPSAVLCTFRWLWLLSLCWLTMFKQFCNSQSCLFMSIVVIRWNCRPFCSAAVCARPNHESSCVATAATAGKKRRKLLTPSSFFSRRPSHWRRRPAEALFLPEKEEQEELWLMPWVGILLIYCNSFFFSYYRRFFFFFEGNDCAFLSSLFLYLLYSFSFITL